MKTLITPVKSFRLTVTSPDGSKSSKRVNNAKTATDFFVLCKNDDFFRKHRETNPNLAYFGPRYERLYRRAFNVFEKVFA